MKINRLTRMGEEYSMFIVLPRLQVFDGVVALRNGIRSVRFLCLVLHHVDDPAHRLPGGEYCLLMNGRLHGLLLRSDCLAVPYQASSMASSCSSSELLSPCWIAFAVIFLFELLRDNTLFKICACMEPGLCQDWRYM